MQSNNMWALETNNCAYCFGINTGGYLVHCYWGPGKQNISAYPSPMDRDAASSFDGPAQVLPLEYPVHGGLFFHEPCLKITFADGTRDLALKFHSATTNTEGIAILLQDIHYPLKVILHYSIHNAYDLIERQVEVINEGIDPMWIERIFSSQWHLPTNQTYYLSHLSGRWNDEFNLTREPLTSGVKVLESRRIASSHHHNPWFMLDAGDASETDGQVWFGALAWSGNWKIAAEVTNFESTRISTGVNDWDFTWKLNGGDRFITPSAFGGYTTGGFGEASRKLHSFIREQVIPHGNLVHKVLYNSWEATLFDVDLESQSRLAEIAAGIGVELFVVDDGWFYRRNSDQAGLGDWWPDPVKFPNGLQPLIRKVNDLGMDFGLWIEPEMVNPNSDLYRAHPDWILRFPNRNPSLARNQCILNMARTDVQEYLIETIDRLLKENKIAFIKWDMNRNASEPGWDNPPGDPREIWVRYVEGLYRVWGELRKCHPDVVWQACSGGGGRADLGILRFADQIWVSDNTHAEARLKIQAGFSMAYPAITMESWVTDADRGHLPLAFRFHVSMCGSLGIGANLLNWSDTEKNEAAFWVATYKRLRDVIQYGDQYRLTPGVIEFMNRDKQRGVIFAYQTSQPSSPLKIKPQGLQPDGLYIIEGVEGQRSGAEWMSSDLIIELQQYESTLREIHSLGF